MKIKSDFVTNSSSTSYILIITPEDVDYLYSFIEELQEKNNNSETSIGNTLETIKELKEYVNGEPLDWVREARGPKFLWMDKTEYDICYKGIKEGKVAIEVSIDYNGGSEFEESDWAKCIV